MVFEIQAIVRAKAQNFLLTYLHINKVVEGMNIQIGIERN